MKFSSLILIAALSTEAQNGFVGIASQIKSQPAPIYIAPGQIISLLVTGLTQVPTQPIQALAGQPLPTSLGGVSIKVAFPIFQVPILDLRPVPPCANTLGLCSSYTAVTVQIPYEVPVACPNLCLGTSAELTINDSNATQVQGSSNISDAAAFSDQVHILRTCDVILTAVRYRPESDTGLPCPAVVTHADGTLVSNGSPAQAGEELIAYATGLGQTNPPSVTGQPVTTSAPTVTTFNMDYNYYRPNALANRPLQGLAPIFSGTTPGYVGLYQVNFRVPAVPSGTLPCSDPSLPISPATVVSNLTVSVGGAFSFDGAGICVATSQPGS